MRYRRVPGGSFFFTVVTEKRRPLFAGTDAVDVLRMAFRAVRSTRPFEVDAMELHEHVYITVLTRLTACGGAKQR